jgi:hypothetical protein
MTKPIPIPLTTKQKIVDFLRSLFSLHVDRWVIALVDEKVILHESRLPKEIKLLPAPAEILLLPASLSEKECSKWTVKK